MKYGFFLTKANNSNSYMSHSRSSLMALLPLYRDNESENSCARVRKLQPAHPIIPYNMSEVCLSRLFIRREQRSKPQCHNDNPFFPRPALLTSAGPSHDDLLAWSGVRRISWQYEWQQGSWSGVAGYRLRQPPLRGILVSLRFPLPLPASRARGGQDGAR